MCRPPLIVALGFLLAVGFVRAAPSVYPTGVTVYQPSKAFSSYVLFDGRDLKSHLIDMNGHEVHSWNHPGFPSEMIDPRLISGKRGHVFVQTQGQGGHGPIVFANQTLAELDWNGKVVWEWGAKAPGGAANQNHDQCRLPNGNTLVLSKVVHSVAGFLSQDVSDQVIYEVSPAGEIVWRWIGSEHLDEFGFPDDAKKMIRSGFSTSGSRSGFLVINDMEPLGPNRRYTAGDERFHPDNVMIDSREGNFIAIIDKKSGRVVWTIGPTFPGANEPPYRRAFQTKVPRLVDQIVGQHDAHMIAEGLPGAGNVLVFDNQGPAGFPPPYMPLWQGSRILEIDPVSKEVIWQYTAEDSGQPAWAFYSSFISSARRLPNGNTLICEGMNGRLFQITRTGEIVWEYVSSYFGKYDLREGVNAVTNWVYRAQPVPYEWVPSGTPRSERAVPRPDVSGFRVPAQRASGHPSKR